MERTRLLRITTVPISLHLLLKGQFRFMREQGFDVYTMSAGGKEVSEVLKEGGEHIEVPLTRKITPVQDLICLGKIIQVIRTIRPHIVHTHTPKAGLLGMLAAWICRVPVRMHTVAGLPLVEATGLKRFTLVITEKITYFCATRVYPNSAGLKDYMIQSMGAREDKLKIIGRGSSNGIDTVYFRRSDDIEKQVDELRSKYGIRKEDVVFSFVGRIVKDKGIGEIIKAFRRISSQAETKVYLLLIGSFEQDLDPLSKEDYDFLHNGENVILAGFQSDVRPWIAASDAFVFPSYREGFPNVVMQACCLMVPCIVSDINGCNEIIQHEKTGIVVPVKDAEAVYQAMVMLMEHPRLRTSYSLAARNYIVDNFDQRFVWKELLNEYNMLLQ
ncbi:MAG TPA: glycosyltransferase family 4 protein [Ohtaekwangia sp.]|uniref:glycosyltransferase family 4 protein n=1 Tax=Ohtaekwangia sp. TaxID=2066019 RepID=UPI002F9418B6